ncbi:GNAT family N-acetyltransferase [Microbacterium sp. ARD31]|uniref:GNAT family N-acetyltransferase n=1 Tax=unclassified Microbacterium TaxID=2609290 RepID=UPI00203E72F9|nr:MULTISPECIES: GNAT family N-acetyltransferase [unclassified Microbacterium]MDT0182578.1 GNAT family N-acetyltransferase [Microbacterium sp. ARD31]
MGHIELRAVDEDDLDAIFEMMRDPDAIAQAAFTAEDPDDRGAFDAWIRRQLESPGVQSWVVTEDGGFAGTAAAFTVDDDREVSFWIARHARGRGVATEALRQLVAREPIRPLFARAATHNAGSIAVLERNGFTEVSRNVAFAPGVGREVEEIVFTLVPALDGV